MHRYLMILVVILGSGLPASAHYHMLLPDRHSVASGQKVVLIYQFGHPFEHEIFDVDKPRSAIVIAPDGKTSDILGSFQKIEVPGTEGKKATAWKLEWTAPGRGDYIFLVRAALSYSDEEKTVLDDSVQTVIHVSTQNGWERRPASDDYVSPLRPLTRPYGLRTGMIFQSEARWSDRGTFVSMEYERFNSQPPKVVPRDEHVTFTALTSAEGTASFVFPEAGWWGVTAVRRYANEQDVPTIVRAGRTYKVEARATQWIPVETEAPRKPVER